MTWFQLTYASSEAAPGRSGGWDVQQVTPGTPFALESQMRAGVTTRLESLDALDEFPTTAELAARTRRLAFRFDDDGGSVWWHSVEAGKDATGRPGNVFTHAVAVSGQPDTLRPIDLWHSPAWLMPFGQKEVAEAALGAFESAGLSSQGAAIERAFARQEETESLLSAVARCLDAGWSLVLASESRDEFVAWLSVISHLTPARVAAGMLAFSTFDRAARLDQVLEKVSIVGIPSNDLAQARGNRIDPAQQRRLVLDLDDLPAAATPDGGWEYAGQHWPESLWQDAFFELTDTTRYSSDDVRSVLALMDERAADGDNYRAIGAPLAEALLENCADDSTRHELLDRWSDRLQMSAGAVEAMSGLDPPGPIPIDAPSLEPRVEDWEVGLGQELGLAGAPHADPAPRSDEGSADTLAFTVSLPPPRHATEAHQHLAKQVLESSGVLLADSRIGPRLEQWVHDFEKCHAVGWQTDEIKYDDGVNDGRDS